MHRTIIDNRYKVLKKLGAGATGTVYKARDLKNKRIIALKILSKKKTSSEAVQRFKREFKLLTELHHPNLCAVYDFGVLKDGRSYFTMEYVDGPNIFEFTKKLHYEKIYLVRKNISNEVYPLIVQLCRVLEYIHSKGLIHYDIKPGNVLIQRTGIKKLTDDVIARSPPRFLADDEAISKPLVNNMIAAHPSGARNDRKTVSNHSVETVVKLMDFGLAGEQRIKGGDLIRGTFPYIAPEVIKGLAVDNRTDLYSLGVLLYEIFTRKRLKIDEKTSFATLIEQQEQVFKLPSKVVAGISIRLKQLIERLLEFEPAQRFSRANDVIKEINKITGLSFEFETEKTLEAYLLSSRFVGRDKEMDILKSLHEKAKQGEGKVILIIGDAGIGKSRLLKEFKVFTQLRHSYCFTGYAHKDKIIPLEPFYDIFKELINYIRDGSDISRSRELKLPLAVLFKMFPDIADGFLKKNLPKLVPLDPNQEKLRTFEALSELIKYIVSSLGELIILLEDLHWADDSSIQFLEYLGRNIEGKNILICGTSRSEELKENLVLQKMTRSLKNEGCYHQLELKPLKFKTLYSFLDSTITPGSNSSELARYLMEKTGGNPFFVEEIMRTLLRKKRVSIGERVEIEDFKRISIPGTIEEIVLRRIKDLDSSSQKIVKFGVILLNDFGYDLMKKLTGLDDTELSRTLWELKSRQVLVEKGNRYRFYHATLREAVHKRLGDKERSDLNYQIGKVLEKINRRRLNEVVEDLAYYFINAKDRKKGATYGLRAAQKSSERYAHEQAIRFYKGVLGLLGNTEPRRRFDILQELAKIEYTVGSHDNAIKYYNYAIGLGTGTLAEKINTYHGLGLIYLERSEHMKTLRILKKAFRLAKRMNPGKLKNLLVAITNLQICGIYQRLGDYKRASKFNINDIHFSPQVLNNKYMVKLQAGVYFNMANITYKKGVYIKTDYSTVIFYYNKANQYYKKIKDYHNIAGILNNLGINYYRMFDLQKAIHCYCKSIKILDRIGDHSTKSIVLWNLGHVLMNKGDHFKALAHLQEAFSLSKKIENPGRTGDSLLALGTCFTYLCNYRRARQCFIDSYSTYNKIHWNEKKFYSIIGIGNVHQADGHYTSALGLYRKALKYYNGIKHQQGTVDAFVNISSAFITVGEFIRAKRYIKDALKIAIDLGAKDNEIECYIQLCRLAILMKDYVSAGNVYKKGLRMTKEFGLKRQSLQFFLLVSEIYYHEKKYLKGIKICNKAIKLAKEMATKDLLAEALVIKAKNEIKHGVLSKIEVVGMLDGAKEIAEEIGCPEVLWKIYFEYGRFLQDDKEYFTALKYYRKCNRIFGDVISRIKNESYRKSYVNRPDRQAVYAAKNEIKKLLN